MAADSVDQVKKGAADKDELQALNALEKEASEYNKDAEIDRIIKTFKLNAYAVLDLQPGVPESDIKATYRKKSLLIHPDKTKNPQAPAAFDALKKAQTVLMDEKERTKLDETIADARRLLMRDRKLTVDSPEIKEMNDEMKAAWRQKVQEVMVENELSRRRQMKAQLREEGREQRKQDEELEARKRRREHEQDWEKTRDTRIDSWRDFQKKGSSTKEKKKKIKVLG